MHYGLNSWHIWHKLKNERKKTPTVSRGPGQEHTRQNVLVVDKKTLESQQGMSQSGNIHFLWILPKFSHSGQPQLQMIQPTKHCTKQHHWLSQFHSAAPLTPLAHPELSGFLPETEDLSNQERFGLEMWHSGGKGRQMCKLQLKINVLTLSGTNKEFRLTLLWRNGWREMIFS